MKYVYNFREGNAQMRELLGGKGANLAEMTNLGLPVPQGFTVSTEACTRYYVDGQRIADEIQTEIYEHLSELEKESGKQFGGKTNPLLVSVRSGARASMPGMMDTILNLGLNDEIVEVIAKLSGNERFALDSYRRLIQMFSDVVMEVEKKKFEAILDEIKTAHGYKLDTDLTAADMREVVKKYKALYLKEKGTEFPQDPKVQLMEAVKAVFRSWNNPRAIVYRRMEHIPESWGTAVNIQSMVFGNMGDDCGTGVAFSRDPSTGEKRLFAEFLTNAQGEDVVAGIRTPFNIEKLHEIMPEIYDQFVAIADKLEKHYCDMQDMEFTIEHRKLYMLQTRNGKRTAAAAVRIACELFDEGMVDKETALLRVGEPRILDALLHDQFKSESVKAAKHVAKGLAASPGAAVGQIVFSAAEAEQAAADKRSVILVRLETSPEDITGMKAAKGILTVRGGMTSHAAVVARGMGACCVAGCGEIGVDEDSRTVTLPNGKVLTDKDWLSIDGSTGKIYTDRLETTPPVMSEYYDRVMKWADEIRVLRVRTNADTPKDAQRAVAFGAEGIGLCRTEHMFFDEDRIPAVREMIVSKTEEERRHALDKLLPMQRDDFKGIYMAMGERPVTIRFLDPPLHEFLPKQDFEIEALAKTMNLKFEDLKATIENLHEMNPMMGHRGCRLGVSYPEIMEMQTRAVIEAAIEVMSETKLNIVPEIMIPLVGSYTELQYIKDVVDATAKKVMAERKTELKYMVGTMIEIPRAALTADEIAQFAQFFSFGTNDLTQMTFGFSRDDAAKFLPSYYDKKIFEADPFEVLDQKGVGKLVKMAAELGRSVRPDIKLGICGEHGGEPSAVEFCHKVGLNYVSCSPFRVPIARLAAAQAVIKNKK